MLKWPDTEHTGRELQKPELLDKNDTSKITCINMELNGMFKSFFAFIFSDLSILLAFLHMI